MPIDTPIRKKVSQVRQGCDLEKLRGPAPGNYRASGRWRQAATSTRDEANLDTGGLSTCSRSIKHWPGSTTRRDRAWSPLPVLPNDQHE
jgi:hypothetical protein